MSARWRLALQVLAGGAALGAAGAWLSGGCGERIAPGVVEAEPAASAGAGAASVERRSDAAAEWASGAVESARRTAVAARILARIEEVRVVAGSEVAEGDLLVRLDARELEARVAEAEEALRGARAALALAQRERDRAAELRQAGVGTEQRLDRAESELRVAAAEVERLSESQREAATAVSWAEIRAPVSGRVVDRLAEPGDTAVPGRPLLRLYDPSALRVEVPVRESLAVRLGVGEPLEVEVPAAGASFRGAIDEIVPFAEPGARTLLVKVRLPADARLFAGMYARVAVPAGPVERLVVPAAAIERVGQLEFATVLPEAGPPERRLVTTGPALDEALVEVLSGLAAGERVALPAAVEPGAAAR